MIVKSVTLENLMFPMMHFNFEIIPDCTLLHTNGHFTQSFYVSIKHSAPVSLKDGGHAL